MPKKKAQRALTGETANQFRQALLAILFEPALLCAAEWGLPLEAVEEAATSGYFRVLRRQRTMRRCAERLGLSMRQAFRLQSRAEENVWLAELEREELSRRILQELAGGAKSKKQLLRLGPDVDVERTLEDLLEADVIVAAKPKNTYKLAHARTRLVEPQGLRFLDGIRFALWPVMQTILARTESGLAPTQSPKNLAWARVFAFAADKRALSQQADLILADALRRIEELDRNATYTIETTDVTRAHLALWLAEDPG